ncbi:MAG: hypothetical protein ACOYT8_04360 [Candidatus Dependentiae bacterium]
MKLYLLSSLLMVLSIQAIEWQNPQDIGFEIRNHDSKPIIITLKPTDTPLVNVADPLFILSPRDAIIWKAEIPGKKIFGKVQSLSKRLDITEPLFLTVEYTDKNNKPAFKHYTFAPNKTVFVAWENNELRPQTGKNGQTQSGLSLNLNVRPFDILIWNMQQNDYVLNRK